LTPQDLIPRVANPIASDQRSNWKELGVTKQELIDRIYRKRGVTNGLTKKAVTEIVDGVFAELGDYFIKTKVTKKGPTPRFTYPGFGTFLKRRRAARTARHPRTGDSISIPATDTVSFNAGSDLKELLNSRK
jgi:nucleoid DNA-binding protein